MSLSDHDAADSTVAAPGDAARPGGRFQILSLDGGGVRGVFTAAILAAIEDDFGVRVTDCFDLIAGTSTGGILAIGLGLGISPHEMVEFYIELGPRIFGKPSWRSTLQHYVRAKFPAAPLAEALRSKFADKPFGASAKRLVVPSFNIGDNDVYVFRTAHLERLRRDYRVPAWQVAMATAAAPTYFPAHQLPDRVRLVDGGVWANNPAMVALTEAVGVPHLAVPLSDVHLLSLGTVSKLHSQRKHLDEGGLWSWRNDAVEVVLDASAIGVSNQARSLLGHRFHRVNALATTDEVRLDDVRTVNDLIAMARHLSRSEMPVIVKRFLQHRASPFTPYYSA